MACRKTNAMFCRVFALVVIIAVAALSWLAFSFVSKQSARAEEVQPQAETQPAHDEVFGANHANATALSAPVSELPTGSYYLTDDVVLTKTIEFFREEEIDICLHGHSISLANNQVFKVYGKSKLNIYDCGGEENCGATIGGGIWLYNGATLNMYSGAITGVDSFTNSGVTTSGGSTFNMYGGIIKDNKSSNSGGGVHIGSGGIFNMYGGTICNNTTESIYGGAGVLVSDATAAFHMYGGTITGNLIDATSKYVIFKGNKVWTKQVTEEDLNLFYKGAGVYVNGGEFTLMGDVNITGNTRKSDDSSTVIKNLEMLRNNNYEGKIEIIGKLENGTVIGVTAEEGAFTNGYTDSGNTQNPSVFFNCDNSGYSIGYDEDLGKEAAVYEGEVIVGNYAMTSATAKSHVGTPKVGDTSISLNIEVTLKNSDDNSTKTVMAVKTVTCPALQVGDNTVSFDYEYKGVTKPVTYAIHLDKVNATVSWTHTGATSTGSNSAERDYDGTDILGNITARYVGYDGANVTVSGTSLIVKKNGATVSSVTEIGVYTISLAPSSVYEFSNGSLTLTVKEAPIDEGYYTMRSATAVVNGTYTAGAATVNLTVTATLKNTVNENDVTTETVTKQISATLHAGDNEIKFTHFYTDSRGGTQSAQITVTVTAAKKSAAVQWYFNGTLASNNAAEHTCNGIDVLGDISAKYTGYNGQTVTVDGFSENIIVKDSAGATVDSVRDAGVYTVSLAPDANHQFTNNTFTVTVLQGSVDDGYYVLQSAVANGVVGDATVGDTEITVAVKMTLVHTETEDVKQNTVNTKVTLTKPLHVGNNTVAFDYKYTDVRGGVQTKSLSLTVTAAKKQVTIRWYYDGTLVSGNAANRLYDGTDGSAKIVAEYDGYDGEQKRINGTSATVIKKDGNNSTVSSLIAAGIYKLSLADSADYVFRNNLFTYTVAENIGDISDLVYEEEEEVILGVSSESGFESGTEVVVEKVEDLDDNLVSGTISSALNVTFVNNSVEITPTGIVTVRVLIPEELKGNTNYKIYNLNNGVATQVRYTTDGDYAIFESDELNTILFVTEETPPVIDPVTPGNNEIVIKIDDSGLVWLWVFLGIVAACAIAVTVAFIVKSKRNKK